MGKDRGVCAYVKALDYQQLVNVSTCHHNVVDSACSPSEVESSL